MMNLYELTQGYLNVLNMSDNDELDDEYIHDTLELLDSEIHDKADNYVRLIKTLEGECLMLNKYLDETQKKLTKKENLIKYLKTNLMNCMIALDETDIKTKFANVKIANNGGIQPIKIDRDKVSIEYMKQEWVVDNAKIREDLEKGKELTFATLEDRGQHIVIK